MYSSLLFFLPLFSTGRSRGTNNQSLKLEKSNDKSFDINEIKERSILSVISCHDMT